MHEASTDFAESRCIDVSFSFKQDGDESEHVVTNMNIDIHQGLPERYILMTGWEGRGIRGPRGNRGRVPPRLHQGSTGPAGVPLSGRSSASAGRRATGRAPSCSSSARYSFLCLLLFDMNLSILKTKIVKNLGFCG